MIIDTAINLIVLTHAWDQCGGHGPYFVWKTLIFQKGEISIVKHVSILALISKKFKLQKIIITLINKINYRVTSGL